MFDLIVGGGRVLDGTGAPAVPADVGVRGGRIVTLGALSRAAAVTRIDATGRYVTPGFIDTHVHADAVVTDPTVQLALLRQGVTTVVLGQDGLSFAPAGPATVQYVTRYFAAINGRHPGIPDGARVGVADLLAGYTGTTAVNTAYLVPHGTVRHQVLGLAERDATADELAAMRRLVESGLADGAVGLSSGLEYLPGRYAGVAELAAICAPLGGLPYVTHMRGYEADAGRGMAEATAVGRAARVPVHVSHYHGPAAELVSLVDAARGRGLDLTFDSYPYLRGSTILAMLLGCGGAGPADRAALLELRAGWPDDLWPRITLSCVDHPDWAWTQGCRLVDAAIRAGIPPADLAVELLLATDLTAGCVFEQPRTNSEESVRALLRHPAQMAGSDGIYQGGHPHPRGFGAFARLLARHVRELGDWDWPTAMVHLASHPARRFGLLDRGVLRPGLAADLVVLDPATVTDRATYERPRQPATGVDHVLVGGVPVLRDGALTGATSGRGLRPT